MTPGQFLNIHFDDAHGLSGWRCMLVLTVGPKWVRFLYPPTAEHIKVLRSIAEHVRSEPVKIRKAKLLKRIRDAAGENKTDAVKEALALVRAA